MGTVEPLFSPKRPAPSAPRAPRPVPHDPAVEAAVLDALVNAPISLSERTEILAALTEDHFHVEANRLAFPAVRDIIADESPIDAVTVAARLRDTPAPEVPDGWVGYLGTVLADQGGTTTVSRKHHTKILDNLRRRREVMRVCDELSAKAAVGNIDAVTLIEEGRASLGSVAMQRAGTARTIADVAHDVFTQLTKMDRRPRTGFPSLDKAIGRLLGGQVTILAARPKCGKTNLAWHIAENIAMMDPEEDDFPEAVFFASAEMAASALYRRQLGIRARVPASAIQDGTLHDVQTQKLIEANRGWVNLPIVLDDFGCANPTPGQIEAAFMRSRDQLAAGTYRNGFGYQYPRCKMRVIIIDHLGKIASPRDNDPRAADPQRLKASMEAVVTLAKRTDSHVIMLWHAGMGDKDPTADLSAADVRGTKDPEGSCDRMLFLTRPKPNRLKIAHYVDRHREALGYGSPIWLETEAGVIWEAENGQYD